MAATSNPPTPAWPAFKFQWLRDHDPEAWQRTSCILMPKDLVNLPLTGERCMDWTDADCFFLMDPDSAQWSDKVFAALGLDRSYMPAIRLPTDVLGQMNVEAARLTGLTQGTPVELAYIKAVKSDFDPLGILEHREISDQC